MWVRGPQLFSGYRDDPAATAATLDSDGWLHTGDLGYVDEAARITLTGRLKELIKVRGYQVAPAELEAVLTSHPAIADACVVGVPDEAAGERPKAWVVTCAPVDEAELHAYVEERVAPYKKLVAIEPTDELPRTMTGKLLRRVLLERERTASRGIAMMLDPCRASLSRTTRSSASSTPRSATTAGWGRMTSRSRARTRRCWRRPGSSPRTSATPS